MDKPEEGSKVWSNGSYTFVEYPDIYQKFVFELHKNHPDIIRGMQLAQVKLEDGSAIDFLNMLLGTEVTLLMPMELGFGILMDSLRMRVQNKLADQSIEKTAAAYKDVSLGFQRRPEDIGKPLFTDEEGNIQ